jgi:hypothetical protein
MTTPDRSGRGSQFSRWLRLQPEIDSAKGITITDFDYFILDRKTGFFMLLEEKRCMAEITFSQLRSYSVADSLFNADKKYKGAWLLQFERTNPCDSQFVKITRIKNFGLRNGTVINFPDERHRFMRFLSMDW